MSSNGVSDYFSKRQQAAKEYQTVTQEGITSQAGLPNIGQLRIKPVFDVGNYGHDLDLNLVLSGTNTTTLVPSTTTITQVLDDSNVPIDEIPTFITDSDEMELVHAGNDTNFSKTWVTHFDMAAWIYKTTFRFAIGCNVSSYSSGNVKIDTVQITMKHSLGSGLGDKVLFNKIIDPGVANMTSATAQMAIFNVDVNSPVKVDTTQPVTIQIQANISASGTSTETIGLVPLFCYLSPHTPKVWSYSGVTFHAHGALDHADIIFRNQDDQNKLDYSGVPPTGVLQGSEVSGV